MYAGLAQIYLFGMVWQEQGRGLGEAREVPGPQSLSRTVSLCEYKWLTRGASLAGPSLNSRWGDVMGALKRPPRAIPDPPGSPTASILTLQSVPYTAARIVFSEACNVYHLFLKSKLIKSIKTPLPTFPVSVSFNSSQHLASGKPILLLSQYMSCPFLPSQPFTFEHLPLSPPGCLCWNMSALLLSNL